MGEEEVIVLYCNLHRIGSHSTSDDQTGYQDMEEVERWKQYNNPVTRLRGYMEHRGLWNQVGHVRQEVCGGRGHRAVGLRGPPTGMRDVPPVEKLLQAAQVCSPLLSVCVILAWNTVGVT